MQQVGDVGDTDLRSSPFLLPPLLTSIFLKWLTPGNYFSTSKVREVLNSFFGLVWEVHKIWLLERFCIFLQLMDKGEEKRYWCITVEFYTKQADRLPDHIQWAG